MDYTNASILLNTLTTDTNPARFAECLVTTPTPPSSLPITSYLEMPLAAAYQPIPPDPLLPSPFMPASTTENTLPTLDYLFPLSAVTEDNSSHDQHTCCAPQLPIQKKRLRVKSPSSPLTNFNNHDIFTPDSAAALFPITSLDMSTTSQPSPLPTRAPTPVAATESQVKPKQVVADVACAPQSSPSGSVIRRRQRARPSSCAKPRLSGSQSSSPTLSKSHTRRCREKVTKQFEYLLQVLPSPPDGVEVKHKAQILEYTINIFRQLLLRRTTLQTEIALSSRSALHQWMTAAISAYAQNSQGEHKSAQSCVPLSAVLEPFVGLYCVKKAWSYGEVWLMHPHDGNVSLSSCVFNADLDDVSRRLNSFASFSRSRYGKPSKVTSGIVNRVIISRRPEWLSDLSSDTVVFDRAQLAGEHGLIMAEAVPVMLDADRCAAVLLFADVKPHMYSTSDLNTLLDYASALGSFYLRYANGLNDQNAVNVSKEKQTALQSSQSVEGVNNVSDCTISAMSTNPCIVQDTPDVYDPFPVAGIIPAASETSCEFFGETDFLQGHLLKQL